MSTQDESLKETGRCAAASIVEMVEALECDYDRLAELRGHRDTLREEFDSLPANAGVDFANWVRNQDLMTSEDVDELAELEAAAGECTGRVRTMKTTATKQAILQQKYVIARELRTLAQIQYGRDSAQFKAADAKCAAAIQKAVREED